MASVRAILGVCVALLGCAKEQSAGTDAGMALDAGGDGSAAAEDGGGEPECRRVTFTYEDPSAQSVWVTGTWTDWAATLDEGAIPLFAVGGGRWEVETVVPAGRHEYKLVVDGSRWVADPARPERSPDGFGGENSVLHVCDDEPPAVCDGFDWRDAVLYFAMVDRFSDSDGASQPVAGATDGDARTGPSAQYEGGDLAGVTTRIDALADLGVTALWLSSPADGRDTAGAAVDPGADPHLYSAYHGYWPSPENIDYSSPDEPSPEPRVETRFGDAGDLEALIAAAHGASTANGDGMKVVFDYVMHHVDVDSGLYAAHPDWFAHDGEGFRPCQGTACNGGSCWDDPYWTTRCAFTSYLPTFDFGGRPEAIEWSVSDAVWWARRFELDGFRLDAIKHVPTDWLTTLRDRIDETFTDPAGGRFFLVGETFSYDDRDLISSFVDPAEQLDGQFDFPLRARLCEAVFRPDGRLDDLASWMGGNDGFYGPDAIMATWIGNHDVPRAIHYASRELDECRPGASYAPGWDRAWTQPADAAPYQRLGVAFAILLTSPGVPLIYYGDEIGLAGGADPDNRRMMVWDDGTLSEHQLALRAEVRTLARVRAEHKALARGSRTTLSADQDTWVYRVDGCGEAVTVAINRSDAPRDVTVPEGSYLDLATGQEGPGGTRSVGARGFLLLGATP